MRTVAMPPAHVAAAFGVDSITPQPLPGSTGSSWRYGATVLHAVADPVLSAWIAGVFDSVRVTDIRVARPIRALDGRWVVGGWSAQRHVAGSLRPNLRETVEVCDSVDLMLAGVDVPRFVTDRHDVTGWADKLAWDRDFESGGRLGSGPEAQLWFDVAGRRREVSAHQQLIHAELFGNVLFALDSPPAAVGFVPLCRPAGFAAAICVVDALAWGGAPLSLVAEVARGDDWPELLRRACLYRLAFAWVHPRGGASAAAAVSTAVRLVRPLFD